MLFRISIVMVVAMNLFLSGCRATGGSSITKSLNESHSIVARQDGNYDVVCRDGKKEVATKSQIDTDEICQGGFSGGCWGACGRYGLPFVTCQEKCGTRTEFSADMCWKFCDKAGYSFNICSVECGQTDVGRGIEACWTRCEKAGFSFATCTGDCGSGMDSGARACWSRCQKSGFIFNTCADKCGVNAAAGAESCWTWCQKSGYTFDTCLSECEKPPANQ